MRILYFKKFKPFGIGAKLRLGAYIEAFSKIKIGRDVTIRLGIFLFADPSEGGGGITIEDDVLLGLGVHCYTNNHKFSDSKIQIINVNPPVG